MLCALPAHFKLRPTSRKPDTFTCHDLCFLLTACSHSLHNLSGFSVFTECHFSSPPTLSFSCTYVVMSLFMQWLISPILLCLYILQSTRRHSFCSTGQEMGRSPTTSVGMSCEPLDRTLSMLRCSRSWATPGLRVRG